MLVPRDIMYYRRMLIDDEGYKEQPYKDSLGNLTIGVGRNLDSNGLYPDEVLYLLGNDINKCLQDLRKIFNNFETFDLRRKAALLNMRFNLGPAGFRSFSSMIQCVAREDWDKAAEEALRSKWAKQLPGRSESVARMMREGGTIEYAGD